MSTTELAKSSSNLNEIVYGGRPRNEEPHVKRSVKKKEEKTEYIVRVDLDELKIDDDDFDDLQSLYQLFDLDKDGILDFKQYEKLLRCIGYRLGEEQARSLAETVSVDRTNHSVSFNEFLKLMSMQRDVEPDEETLLDMFSTLDKHEVGFISESSFKKIMSGKDDVGEADIAEMLEEYYRLAKLKGTPTARPEGLPEASGAEPAAPAPHPGAVAKPAGAKPKRKGSKAPPASILSGEGEDHASGSVGGAEEVIEERWIDYKEFVAMLQQ